jgi:hypothetical protein
MGGHRSRLGARCLIIDAVSMTNGAASRFCTLTRRLMASSSRQMMSTTLSLYKRKVWLGTMGQEKDSEFD